MGQTVGKAPLLPSTLAFLNLPKNIILELFEAFNDIAEGFGLTLDEFQEIVRVTLKEYLGYSEKKINALAEDVFHVFDDDENSLIDALEFLSSFALLSGMTVSEKVRYIFGIYDFDESGLLSVDEMTLALRSSISGLTKLSGLDPPSEAEIEQISVAAFDDAPTSGSEAGMISRDLFVEYAIKTPEISSWINYYGDLDEVDVSSFGGETFSKALVAREGGPALKRTERMMASMDLDSGSDAWLDIEAKGYCENFLPLDPWQNTVSFTEPSTIPKEIPFDAPETTLSLDWIHGYNSRESRQNVFYNKRGDSVIYPAGAVGVNLSIDGNERKQKFSIEHTDKIMSLAVYNVSKTFSHVATGQVGLKPKICVWASHTMENLVTILGFHKVGVNHLAFSPNGEYLVSVGMDEWHSLAVYDWKAKTALFTSVSTLQPVLDARWLGTDDYFATCGQNHVHFWSRHGNVFHRQRGLFGKKISLQAITCVACVNKYVVSGATTGHLCVWEGRNCVRAIKAHSGSITALYVAEGVGLCTASADGKVQLWSDTLDVGSMFDVSALGGVERSVSSVCWDPSNRKILVGMWSSEIFEINDAEGYNIHDGALVSGHFGLSVYGIAVNPINPNQYVTVGQDKTVRIWDAVKQKIVRMAVFDTMARCVAYSADGTMIAVGLGGGSKENKQKKDGAFIVLNEEDLTIIHEARDSKQTLTDVKFSLDGNSLAFGSMDRCIYVYNVGDFASKAKARGHKGAITHIDFGRVFGTNNAVFLQSNSDAGEIMFWDIETGEQQTPRNQRDTDWETQTCTLGWPLKGAWGPFDDGAEVTACGRSSSGELIATTDNFGRIRVYRYPAIHKNPNYLVFRGHAANITNVKFSPDDAYIFTSGADDCCVMQWRHEADGYDEQAGKIEANPEDEQDLADGAVFDKPANWEIVNTEDLTYTFAMEELARDSDFMPIKPWQRTIVAPSRPPPENITEPDDDLSLEWIHGYRGHDCRSNLFYGVSGQLIYNIANTVVRYNVKESVQDFFQDAKDEILCLAIHPDRPICAVGQAGRVPYIHIFDYESMTGVQVFHGHHRRAITNLTFDPTGRYLLSVGMDEYHKMVIFDWENGSVKASSTTTEKKTLSVAFLPDGKGCLQAGDGFIRFWSLDGHILNYKSAILGDKGKIQPFFSVGFTGNFPVVGTTDGHLYRFLGRKLDVAIKAHSSTVYSIHGTNEGICTGSRDGVVKIWSQSLECKIAIDIQMLGSLNSSVKSVFWDNELGKILVGTAGNEIWEVSSSDGSNMHLDGPLEQGHFDNELWGLSINPTRPHFATVGDDKTLRVWDLFEHKVIKMTGLEMMSRACCYSPDGTMIAVGFGSPVKKSQKQFDGKWMIMSDDDFSILYEARDSQKWITEMKWTPGGDRLAVGAWDNKIYLYEVDMQDRSKLEITLTAVISQHNSFITHFDFSADNKFIQSNCGAFELCYFESDTGMYIPAASRLKDVRWDTQTCTLGWPVEGCWPSQNDGTNITAVDCNLVNEHGNLIAASGDNFGRLSLARYPCRSAYSIKKQYRGHCGHICKVRWAGGDSHLISVGATDKAVMVWRHEADDMAVMDSSSGTTPDPVDDSDVEDDIPVLDGDVPSGAGGAGDGAGDNEEVKNTNLERPWIAGMVEPTNPPKPNPDLPDSELELVYAHGFCSQTTRNSLAYNCMGELVYPTASICVVYNKETHGQRFFRGHNCQVSACAVSPNGRFVASGVNSMRPQVRVWDAQTCAEIVCLREFHRVGIVSIAISPDCKRIVSVGADADRSIAVWYSLSGEWFDGKMQCNAKGTEKVMFAQFGGAEFDYMVVSGGMNHIKFWKVEGANMVSCRGIFGSVGKVQPMLCGAAVGSKFVTGTVSGHLYVWTGRKLEKIVRAHEKGINAIHSSSGGLVTGGKDGFIKIWSLALEHLRSYDLAEAQVPPLNLGVRSVYAGLDVTGTAITKVLVGTKGSEIYEIAMKSGSMILLHEGHHSNETWGLAMHPTDKDIYATCGDDQTIRIWSVGLNRMLRKLKTDTQMRSIAWSNDGKRLLVGCGGNAGGKRGKKDGAFLIIDTASLEVKFEGRDSRHWIRDVKFSPDGTSFAVASMDQKIYLYENNNFVLRARAEKHNASILFFDWSTDSQMVQSDSADFEHLNHNANDGAHFGLPSQLKNVDYETYTCVYGWPVQGIHPAKKLGGGGEDHLEPICAHRSKDRKLLATGSDKGDIRLFNYPVISKNSKFRKQTGHSSDVANCRFSSDDNVLITIGKHDRTILVWKVKRVKRQEEGAAAASAGGKGKGKGEIETGGGGGGELEEKKE